MLPQAIHDAPERLVIALTGGGAGALAALLQTPGASRTVLEAIVPYSLASLTDWLGSAPEQACSCATARSMAMTAWLRARELDGATNDVALGPVQLLGVGGTASLASDRPKRGVHRAHIAIQSVAFTQTWRLQFDSASRDRGEEEALLGDAILLAIAGACGLETDAPRRALESRLSAAERLEQRSCRPPLSWSELLLGVRRWCLASTTADEPPKLVFPGAFNPVHAGHLAMASLAETRLGLPLCWELSLTNVDKPPLDFLSLEERLQGLRRLSPDRSALLTCAPTFREKAALFPGAWFVVGADTAVRIGDVRYYCSWEDRDAALAEIANSGCRFLVFGRQSTGRFTTLDSLGLPASLANMCEAVSEADFRADISSTQIRHGEHAGGLTTRGDATSFGQ